MNEISKYLTRLLEDDGEDFNTLSDILGPNFDSPAEEDTLPGKVERHDRWANIEIGDLNFCISYLTPVAVFIPGEGLKVTQKNWSKSTKNHITKWCREVGAGPRFTNYADLERQVKTMPQDELTALFKEKAQLVKWTKRQAKHAERLPNIATGLISDYDDRIDIRPS